MAPDLVLTAMHVVADRNAPTLTLIPGRIVLTFPTHSTDATVVDDCWDPRADWALLKCATAPPAVRPIPLSDEVNDGEPWESFGFPDANPRDGLAQVGTVTHAAATFETVAAHQLYSDQAAGGSGAPEAGASGSPIIVGGAVVGLMRASLMKEGMNVAGTLYVCPIDSVLDRCGKLLPLPDPCRGLPGLPQQRLPAEPFRFLHPFSFADAELFFGRNAAIRELHDLVTNADAPRVVLLYGQSGAGKSSLLDAGVLPRLRAPYAVAYARRDRQRGLLGTLIEAVVTLLPRTTTAPSATLSGETLRRAWRDVEAANQGPLIVVLDQLEEAFTQPSGDPHELATFVDAVRLLMERPGAPSGRLVLGFRKEWLAEIKRQLDAQEIEWRGVFLRALDAESVVEVVTGLTRTKRLKARYAFTVADGLPAAIAQDLTADRHSPVAPMLQVLLSRMWRDAKAISDSQPAVTLDVYEKVKNQGFLLADFLDQQLAVLAESATKAGGTVADAVTSGLALDVLRFHVSDFGTAKDVSRESLLAEYERDDEVAWLVQELKSLYLLSEGSGEGQQASTDTRLAHDTLGAAVRSRFDGSQLPGQRGRRIVENRAAEWIGDKDGTTLDTRDLELVERGLIGMRALRPHEQRLVEASREVRRGGAAAQARQAAERQLMMFEAQIPMLLDIDPAAGLVAAIVAVDRSLEMDGGHVRPRIQEGLAQALDRARERCAWPLGAQATAVVIDRDGRVAAATQAGEIHLIDRDGSSTRVPIQDPEERQRDLDRSPLAVHLAVSDDGALIAAALGVEGVRVWSRDGRRVTPLPRSAGLILHVRFAPGTHVLTSVIGIDDAMASGQKAGLWTLDIDSGSASTVFFEDGPPHLANPNAAALLWTPDGRLLVAVAGGTDGGPVGVWNADGTKVIGPLDGEYASVDLAVTPDGVLLAGGGYQQSQIWNAMTGELLSAFEPSPFVRFAGSDHLLKSSILGGAVTVCDWSRNEEVLPSFTTATLWTLAVAPDAECVATEQVMGDHHVSIIEMLGLKVHASIQSTFAQQPTGALVSTMAFVPNSNTLLVGGEGDYLEQWDVPAPRGTACVAARMTRLPTRQHGTSEIALDALGTTLVLVGKEGIGVARKAGA